jgi:hypothetical protein
MNTSYITQNLTFIAILFFALSLTSQGIASPESNAASETVSFSQEVLPVLMDRCAICHQAEDRHGYLVVDLNNTLAGIVNVPSFSVPALMRVEPGNPEQSYLWLKLTGKHYEVGGSGWKMPYMSRLTKQQLQAIYDWIDQGAKDN